MPAWVLVLLWLFNQTHYREQLRSLAQHKPGILDVFWYSPQLLHGTTVYQTALFFWIWVPLLFFIGVPLWVVLKRKRNRVPGTSA